MREAAAIDRLGMRARPEGPYVMEQNWENLLFLHWPFDEAVVRSLIPAGLDIDTFDGKAWVGITPFRLTGLRFLSLPPIPTLDTFNEVNLRTYVVHNGVPGIWFFSLDASKILPALGARLFFNLPYYDAKINYSTTGSEFSFDMTRTVARRRVSKLAGARGSVCARQTSSRSRFFWSNATASLGLPAT